MVFFTTYSFKTKSFLYKDNHLRYCMLFVRLAIAWLFSDQGINHRNSLFRFFKPPLFSPFISRRFLRIFWIAIRGFAMLIFFSSANLWYYYFSWRPPSGPGVPEHDHLQLWVPALLYLLLHRLWSDQVLSLYLYLYLSLSTISIMISFLLYLLLYLLLCLSPCPSILPSLVCLLVSVLHLHLKFPIPSLPPYSPSLYLSLHLSFCWVVCEWDRNKIKKFVCECVCVYVCVCVWDS